MTLPAIHYMNADRGIKSWFLTLDHKRIALMYLVLTFIAFILGGIFAMALRIEHLTPDRTIMGANTYNRMFTLHGVVMIFLFMIPAIPGIFGNFCPPHRRTQTEGSTAGTRHPWRPASAAGRSCRRCPGSPGS